MAAGAAAAGGMGGVACEPAFAGADVGEVVLGEAVLGEPRGAVGADDGVNLGDPLQALGAGEPAARGGAVLEEVFLPEGAAAEHARAAALHRHLDLFEVVGVIDPRRQQDPGTLARLGQGVQVVVELVVALVAEGAGELGLVDITISADDPGRLDHRLGLAVEVLLVGLLLAVIGEGDRFQQEQDVVLLAVVVDLFQKGEVMLGGARLARLERGEQLDRVGPQELDLLDAPARLVLRERRACLVLRAARLLDPDQEPLLRRDRAGGDRRPRAVVGVDQDPRTGRGHVPGHVELRLDDLLVGRRAVLPLRLERVVGHLDHRAILIEGQHRQRPVRVADPLQAPDLARRQAPAQ